MLFCRLWHILSFSPTLELVMHIYSADCDCAVCSMERFDDHINETLEKMVPCSRCGVPHVDTYKWLHPICMDCEKDMVLTW